MPIYCYSNDHTSVFMDLVVGVNGVQVHKGDGSKVPEPSTVQLSPGDYLTTETPYVHPYLDDVPVLPELLATVPATTPES